MQEGEGLDAQLEDEEGVLESIIIVGDPAQGSLERVIDGKE